MGQERVISNSTFAENSTAKPDFYCEELSVGPLIWISVTIPAVCAGLPACVWLLWVCAQRQHSGLAINIYMLNVTIMDLIVNIFIPLTILNNYFWKDDAVARAGMMSFCITTTGRPLFAVCTCFDCYMAALLPIRYLQMRNSRYKLMACSLVWSVTFAFGVTYASNYNLIFTPLLMSPFAVSLALIVFFDVSVLHALRKPDPSGRRDVHPQKRKALRTITFNLAVTVVAYLFPVVAFGFSSLMPLKNNDFFCNVGIPSCIVPVLRSALTPLLYLKKLGVVKDVNGCIKEKVHKGEMRCDAIHSPQSQNAVCSKTVK